MGGFIYSEGEVYEEDWLNNKGRADCTRLKTKVCTKVTTRKTFEKAKGDAYFLMKNYTTKMVSLPETRRTRQNHSIKVKMKMN